MCLCPRFYHNNTKLLYSVSLYTYTSRFPLDYFYVYNHYHGCLAAWCIYVHILIFLLTWHCPLYCIIFNNENIVAIHIMYWNKVSILLHICLVTLSDSHFSFASYNDSQINRYYHICPEISLWSSIFVALQTASFHSYFQHTAFITLCLYHKQ